MLHEPVQVATAALGDAPIVAHGEVVAAEPVAASAAPVATAEPVAQPPVVVAAAPHGAHGPRECKGCGVEFTPRLGTNPASGQFMRCSKCNSLSSQLLGAFKFW
jgi:hypothetical protein